MISLKDVTKVYESGGERVEALRGINLYIGEGEFIALVGPSGSGKSTLLGILGALNPPTTGEVLVDSIPVYSLAVERRADLRSAYIGFVFQQFHLVPYLSALQNVLLPLAILKYSHTEQKVRAVDALDKVGLSGKYHRLPDHLSGGEQERVAIARAIVNQPPIIYADEPTGSLDSKTGAEIMDLFSSLKLEGLTIVMVTHNENTLDYVDRVVQLRDGQIV